METQTPPNASAPHAEAKSHLPGLEGFFDTYLRIKAPFQLPKGAKDFIVQYGPWITLVVLILAAIAIIPLTLLALGLTTLTAPLSAAAGNTTISVLSYISIAIGLVTLVMEAVAIPKLLKRQLAGWKLVYYAGLLSALNSLIDMRLISLVLGLVVSMYILFQIREYYK